MKFDIVALGELLIDFTPRGKSEYGSDIFEANPGGAPCNVLAAAGKLNKSTAFIGKVGTDMFGSSLKHTIEAFGINTSGLMQTPDYFTTLAFVSLDENGNRSFSFSRKNSADVMLSPDEVNTELIKKARIFYGGTSWTRLTDDSATAKKFKELSKTTKLVFISNGCKKRNTPLMSP